MSKILNENQTPQLVDKKQSASDRLAQECDALDIVFEQEMAEEEFGIHITKTD